MALLGRPHQMATLAHLGLGASRADGLVEQVGPKAAEKVSHGGNMPPLRAESNAALLACYRSGQMCERDMQERMRADDAFAAFVRAALL